MRLEQQRLCVAKETQRDRHGEQQGNLERIDELASISIVATIQPSAAGTTIFNQATVSFDNNGDGTNESSVLIDDPFVAGDSNPTAFAVGLPSIVLVPTLSWLRVLALGLLLALIGAGFRMRRIEKI